VPLRRCENISLELRLGYSGHHIENKHPITMPITRRSLLGLISSSTFIFSASGAVLANSLPPGQVALRFPQGVASADPRPDAVMLWTRAEPVVASDQVQLLLQVSTSPDFSVVVVDALLETSEESD
jgi:alkaline phosphatase D